MINRVERGWLAEVGHGFASMSESDAHRELETTERSLQQAIGRLNQARETNNRRQVERWQETVEGLQRRQRRLTDEIAQQPLDASEVITSVLSH